MAINKLNFSSVDIGRVDLPQNDLAKSLMQYGNQLNETERQRRLDAQRMGIENNKLMMDQARFDREKELNTRVDTEYNREIGLRDMRKDLAAQYEANPYADIWGGGAATKALDKQVIDYVNAGGEITPDMAGRLQSEYEKNRPFKEDLSQVFRSKLLAAGEDPTKADVYAKSMTDNMPFSRVTQQAQLDKQQEVTQKWYDAQATANLEALKLNMDANKINANNATEVLKSRISSGFGGASGGGGSKGTAPGGYANLTADELSLSWMPAFTKMGDEASTQDIINGLQAKSVPSGIAQKALEESVVTKGADRYVDKNLLKANVDRYMGVYGQTAAGGASATTVNAEVNPKTLLAQFAPRQIAGYDPQGVLERAKTAVPELFGKEGSNSLPGSGAGRDVPSSEIKKLVVDKYGDSNFNKSTYDKNLSEVESGGNYNAYNATSKAFGKYQFVPSTINSLIKQDGSKHTIDEVRKSPELQDYYYDKLTKENINTLKGSGVPVNNFTVYMAHNLGPSQTENFFSNEPLTEATKKAIQAQGVAPTREAYTSRFMHKFENTATPEEKRPTVQKEDISRMTDAERKAYADRLFPELATEGPIKELFSNVAPNKLPASDLRLQMDALNSKGITTKDDEVAFNNLQKQYKIAQARELDNSEMYKMKAPELLSNLLGVKTTDKPIIEDTQEARQQRIAEKYKVNPAGLSADEKRWVEGNKQTPNGRKLLESLGIK